MARLTTVMLGFSAAAIAIGAAAATPEATDPDVARCAAVLTRQLQSNGFAGRPVQRIVPDRGAASIDRWEAPFSAQVPTKVATLIRVPLAVAYRDDSAAPREMLEGRCGYTSGRLLATEIVPASR